MGLDINKIIELENGKKYLLTKKTMYLGNKYYFANLYKDNQVDNQTVKIFKESMSGVDTFVSEINSNNENYETLTRIFDAQN